MAPAPASNKPIAPYVPGHAVTLPAPQTVHAVVPAELAHPRPAAAGEKPGAPGARTPEAKEVGANQAMRAAPKPEPNPAMTMKKEAEPAHQPPKEEQDAAAKKRAADAAEANKMKADAAAEANKKKADAAAEAKKQAAEKAAAEKAAAEKRKENPPQ
jgi:hypothetical protein